MILYHGTNLCIDKIDLSVCRPNKDFGKGFYLTTLEDQAQKMAKRVSAIYGGRPIVNVYQFDEINLQNPLLNIRFFDKPSIEWALFVTNNRNRILSGEHNVDLRYDIVVGPVADDDLSLLFRQFTGGLIDEAALKKGMEFRKLTDQYSFHTKKAIEFLTKERDYHVQA